MELQRQSADVVGFGQHMEFRGRWLANLARRDENSPHSFLGDVFWIVPDDPNGVRASALTRLINLSVLKEEGYGNFCCFGSDYRYNQDVLRYVGVGFLALGVMLPSGVPVLRPRDTVCGILEKTNLELSKVFSSLALLYPEFH